MVYVQAQIKLHPGKQTEFVSLLNTLMPLLNKHGWKLIGSFSALVGRFNTVLDLWELPNPNAVESLLSDPAFAKYAPTIHEIVEDEVLTVMSKLPIG